MTQSCESLFFDLDGTLLDTAPDLVAALNDVLLQHHRPIIAFEVIRAVIAEGTPAILHQGFAIDKNHPEYQTIRQEFLFAYQARLTNQTQLFQDIDILLNYLDENNLPWGIVTNKPGWLAQPLIEHFDLHRRSRCLVAGDTLAKRKPDPEPLYHACKLAGVDPKRSLYLGDAEVDVKAAKSAGMMAIVAKYGYIGPHQQPQLWEADGVIESPIELIHWISKGTLS